MKKMLYVVSALAALSLIAPSAGFAQTAFNQIGIYTTMTGDPATANVAATPSVPFNAYLVLTNPVNETFNGAPSSRPVTLIDGFECKILKPTVAGFFQLAQTFPASEINVGAGDDYVVGFASPVPVTNNVVVLISWQLMVLFADAYEYYLGPTDLPSVAGAMSFQDTEDVGQDATPLQAAYPANNNFSAPIFSINSNTAVSVEEASFGSVKSLFR